MLGRYRFVAGCFACCMILRCIWVRTFAKYRLWLNKQPPRNVPSPSPEIRSYDQGLLSILVSLSKAGHDKPFLPLS